MPTPYFLSHVLLILICSSLCLMTGLFFFWKHEQKKLREEQAKQRQAAEEERENTNKLLKELAKSELIDRWERYMERGYVSTYGLANYHTMMRLYEERGGNGLVPQLYEQIKKLPIEDKERVIHPW